jgi:plasmid stability protein
MEDCVATLILENIPEDLYDRLKASAQAHRRSLHSEILACLEAVLIPGRVSPAERIARARILRASFRGANQRDVDAFKRKGRA